MMWTSCKTGLCTPTARPLGAACGRMLKHLAVGVLDVDVMQHGKQ